MTTTKTTKVTIYWAGNEGNHANAPFKRVRAKAFARLRAKDLPDVANNVGYEAYCILKEEAKAALARVATLVRDGIETSVYEGDEAKIRKVCDELPAVGSYLCD
jgi:hypothetical protein